MNVIWCRGCLRNTIFFATEDCESYWRGCIQAAIVILQKIVAILAIINFLLKFVLKGISKSFFFALASRSGFGAVVSDIVAHSCIVIYNSISADRIVMAASRLLGAAAACVIVLYFAAGSRKSYWSGCIQAATMIYQQISIIFIIIFLLKIP
jgi:hypothetical protein